MIIVAWHALLTPASCLARFNTDGAGDDADDDADGGANNDSNDDDEEEEEEEVDDVKEKAAPSAEVKGDGEGNGFFAAGDTCYACFPEVNAVASPRALITLGVPFAGQPLRMLVGGAFSRVLRFAPRVSRAYNLVVHYLFLCPF